MSDRPAAKVKIGRVTTKAINWARVAAQSGAPPKPDRSLTFVLPTPPPGVVPEGAETMAMDQEIVAAYGWAQQAGFFGEGLGWLGYSYLAELTQRPEYRRGAEIIAKTLTRKWIKMVATGKADKSEKLKALDVALKRFKVRDAFRRACELDGFFGRSQIYFDTGATDRPDELRTPLPIDAKKIGKGSLKRLGVIEPMWTYPNDYNSSDPLRPDYYVPQTWFIQGKLVHTSRLLTFVGRELPDILKPAYVFGGLSLTQMAKPYVDNWLRTRQSVSDLIYNFSTMTLATDMVALQESTAGLDGLLSRVMAFNNFRSNRGTMLINKSTEELSNVSVPLGTLDHLQAQAQEQMASVQGIPLVVLLGITPSGLNASTDGEIRTWYDWCHAQQEDFFSDNLKRCIDVIQLSEFGEIDPDIGFEFVPLWELDEAGRAATRQVNATTDQTYVDMGALDPADVRQALAGEENNRYAGVDLSGPPPEPPDDDDTDGGGGLGESIAKRGEEGSETEANSGV